MDSGIKIDFLDLKAAEAKIKELELYQKRDKEIILQLEDQVWKHAERINELQNKLTSHASSHGLYVTQTLEPKIEELKDQNARLREVLDTAHYILKANKLGIPESMANLMEDIEKSSE